MPKIFISYRRSDSEQVTGRLYDRLVSEYGLKSVFKDVDSIKHGADFRDVLANSLKVSDIVLIIIGQQWLGSDNEGDRRIDAENDFVRIEVEKALARNDIRVIPVLVNNADLPAIEKMPKSIQDLVFRNAVTVRTDPDFHNDMSRIIRGINRDFPKHSWLKVTAASACFLLAGGLAVALQFNQTSDNPKQAVPIDAPKPVANATDKSPTNKQTAKTEAVKALPELKEQAPKTINGSLQLDNKLRLKPITSGQFTMGSKARNQSPANLVKIKYSFWISDTEITFDQYDAYVKQAGPSHRPDDNKWGRGARPVVNVSWNDAQGYTSWLSRNNAHKLQCRLPSEAEWEYAARAGTKSSYFWGNKVGTNNAHCDDCKSARDGKETAPVKSFQPNRLGLYDMHGNVSEWVQDTWHENYQAAPADGSAWESRDGKNLRVKRGGSWRNKSELLRSSYRLAQSPSNDSRNLDTGFRVVCLAQ